MRRGCSVRPSRRGGREDDEECDRLNKCCAARATSFPLSGPRGGWRCGRAAAAAARAPTSMEELIHHHETRSNCPRLRHIFLFLRLTRALAALSIPSIAQHRTRHPLVDLSNFRPEPTWHEPLAPATSSGIHRGRASILIARLSSSLRSTLAQHAKPLHNTQADRTLLPRPPRPQPLLLASIRK